MPEINNLKLNITGAIAYQEIKEFCEFALTKKYKILFVDNGNIVFTKEQNVQ